jgi:hypothetical protein
MKLNSLHVHDVVGGENVLKFGIFSANFDDPMTGEADSKSRFFKASQLAAVQKSGRYDNHHSAVA